MSTEKMDQQEADNKDEPFFKYFKTASISLAFLALGLAIAMPGPTLPTLAYNLNIDISSMSQIIPARAVGYLFGSFFGGFLYERLNQHALLFLALLLTSTGLVLSPFATNLTLLAAVMSTIGLSMGILDTGGNVLILEIWQEKSGPYMQNLHFMFALGATLAPLVATPFLRSTEEILNSTVGANRTYNFSAASHGDDPVEDSEFPFVAWAFVIAAIYTLLVSLPFLYLAFRPRTAAQAKKADTMKEEGLAYRLQMLFLLFLFFLVYVGVEVAFGVYIFTFATTGSKFSKEQASGLNTTFWAFFAVGRGLAIVFAIFLSPAWMLRGDLLGTAVSCAVLVCYPYYMTAAPALLWAAVAGYGLSIASIFPSGFSWAEQFITINGRAASALVFGGALGEMVIPLVVGQLIERDAMNLMYSAAVCLLVSLALYLVMHLLASSRGKRRKLQQHVEPAATNQGENLELIESAST